MSRLAKSAGAVALLAAAIATGAQSAPASISGNNGWIAFDSRRGGDVDVYRVGPLGFDEQLVAASVPGANDGRPSWAPQADFHLFLGLGQPSPPETRWSVGGENLTGVTEVRVGSTWVPASDVQARSLRVELPLGAGPDSELCASKPLGGNGPISHMVSRTHGVQFGGFLDASCDSQPLAFHSDRSGDYDIWVYDPASPLGPANPVNVTKYPGAHDTAPVWSPAKGVSFPNVSVRDKPLIAFESDRFGSRDIFVLDPFRPLSSNASAPNPARLTNSPGDEANPEWSQSGRHLLFESDAQGPKDIWRIEVPAQPPYGVDNGLQQLTADAEPSFEPTWTVFDPQPEPFVSAIVFSGPESATGDCELNTIAEEGRTALPGLGSSMLTLESPATKDDSPTFAANANPLVFQSVGADGNEDIVAYDITGGSALRRLTTHPGADRHPSSQAVYLGARLEYYRPIGRPTKRRKRRARASAAGAAPCSEPPFASFESSPARPRPGDVVTFDATNTRDVDGPIDRYEWDLDGNGSFESASRSPIARRALPVGVHDIVLRAVDQDGAARRLRRQVAIGTVLPVRCTSTGTPGPDVLAGTPGRDVLCGLGGNDVIYGEGGGDVVLGGPGNDRLFGGDGRDRLDGGRGHDTGFGNGGPDRLDGRAGRDRLNGGGGNDRLFGHASADRLHGGAGADRLNGGAAADRLVGSGGRDRLVGGPGRDVLLAADRRRDHVIGGRQRDRARVDARDRISGVERARP